MTYSLTSLLETVQTVLSHILGILVSIVTQLDMSLVIDVFNSNVCLSPSSLKDVFTSNPEDGEVHIALFVNFEI